MGSSKLRARSLATLALAALGLGAGCYSTTPHQARVASSAPGRECADVVGTVFARSGFIQLPAPPEVSMFFGARLQGPYDSFVRSGAGVGVKIDAAAADEGRCNIAIEALSPDVACMDTHAPMACGGAEGTTLMDPITGDMGGNHMSGVASVGPCPIVRPVTCQLCYAPGADNDAAVDELARRVQAELGSRGRAIN
jgi:hypothetical protein